MQEDILERRAPNEHALRMQTEGVDPIGGGVAVIGVEERSVRQRLDPPGEAVEGRADTEGARTRRRAAGARARSLVDERAPGQVQKDVLERGPANEHAFGLQPELMHARGGGITVVRVQQQSVG